MMKPCPFLGPLWVSICLITGGFAHADELLKARTAYDERINTVNAEYEDSVDKLHTKYLFALDRSRKDQLQKGNLEEILLIEEEKQWVTNGPPAPALPEDAGPSLRQLRSTFNTAMQNLQSERLAKQKELSSTYIAYLGNIQRQRVTRNDIEGALKCREEILRVSTSTAQEPDVQAMPPDQAFQEGDDDLEEFVPGKPYKVEWSIRNAPGQARYLRRKRLKGVDLELSGDDKLTASHLYLGEQGRTIVPKVGRRTSTYSRRSGQFTLIASFATNGLNQSGPARIISLSQGSSARNFTLGQENEELILRFRTTKTNANGDSPTVSLGRLQKLQPTTVVVTFKTGEGLRAFRDGKEVRVEPLGGSLENWENMKLVLGNEVGAERPWNGMLYNFELQALALNPMTAAQRSRTPTLNRQPRAW